MGTPAGLHTSYPFFALTKASYITYLLPFLCPYKGLIHHIPLTLSLPSQRPHTSHTSYPFFAFTKASYITYLLPFLCPHKGLIHHIPLTLSLPSQRPSHILPFFCNHKGLIHFTLSLPSQKPHTSHTSYPFFAITKALYITYRLPFVCLHKGLIHHIHLTLSLPSQRPHPSYPFFAITKATYILPFLCHHKGHIHLTLSLPSQRPHTSYPFFAFTKASYTTSILPFLCHHKGLQLLGGGDGGEVWLFGGAICPDVHIHLILVASRVNHARPSKQLERAQPQGVQLARECKALPSIMHIYSHRSVRLRCKEEIITTLE